MTDVRNKAGMLAAATDNELSDLLMLLTQELVRRARVEIRDEDPVHALDNQNIHLGALAVVFGMYLQELINESSAETIEQMVTEITARADFWDALQKMEEQPS